MQPARDGIERSCWVRCEEGRILLLAARPVQIQAVHSRSEVHAAAPSWREAGGRGERESTSFWVTQESVGHQEHVLLHRGLASGGDPLCERLCRRLGFGIFAAASASASRGAAAPVGGQTWAVMRTVDSSSSVQIIENSNPSKKHIKIASCRPRPTHPGTNPTRSPHPHLHPTLPLALYKATSFE